MIPGKDLPLLYREQCASTRGVENVKMLKTDPGTDSVTYNRNKLIWENQIRRIHDDLLINRESNLCEGIFDPTTNCVNVVRNIAKCPRHFGHKGSGKIVLTPEEAFFLVEMKKLLVKFSGVAMSIEDCYKSFLNSNAVVPLTSDVYLVFQYLSRQGFVVKRRIENSLGDAGATVSQSIQTSSKTESSSAEPTRIVTSFPLELQNTSCRAIGHTSWRQYTEFRPADSPVILRDSRETNSKSTVSSLETPMDSLNAAGLSYFSGDNTTRGHVPTGFSSWSDYKQDLRDSCSDEVDKSLFSVGEFPCTETLFDRLQTFSPSPLQTEFLEKILSNIPKHSNRVGVLFDVYLPKARKLSCPRPDHCVVVSSDRHTPTFPLPHDLISLRDECRPIPIRYAFVDDGSVTFYSISMTDVPSFPFNLNPIYK